jgi:hypothetical protein
MRLRLLQHVRHLAENADHVLALPKRHRTDLHREALSIGVDDDHRCVGHLRVAENLAGDQLACSTRVLGGHDGRELPPDLVTDHFSSSAVHPPNDAHTIDDVAGYVHRLEHPSDVCPHRLQRFDGHQASVAHSATRASDGTCWVTRPQLVERRLGNRVRHEVDRPRAALEGLGHRFR